MRFYSHKEKKKLQPSSNAKNDFNSPEVDQMQQMADESNHIVQLKSIKDSITGLFSRKKEATEGGEQNESSISKTLSSAAGTVGSALGADKAKEELNNVKEGRYADSEGNRRYGALGRLAGRGLQKGATTGQSVNSAVDSGLKAGKFLEGAKDAASPAMKGAATASGAFSVATGAMDLLKGGYNLKKSTDKKSNIHDEINQTEINLKSGKDAWEQRDKEHSSDKLDWKEKKNQFANDKNEWTTKESDYTERLEMLRHMDRLQSKKQSKGALNAVTGALDATAGALTLSGVAAPVGMALGATSMAIKGGKAAYSKIKQYGRDRKERHLRDADEIGNDFDTKKQKLEEAKEYQGYNPLKLWKKRKANNKLEEYGDDKEAYVNKKLEKYGAIGEDGQVKDYETRKMEYENNPDNWLSGKSDESKSTKKNEEANNKLAEYLANHSEDLALFSSIGNTKQFNEADQDKKVELLKKKIKS